LTRMIKIAALAVLLNSLFGATTFAQAPPPLPTGNNGIAAKYPGDVGIGSDSAVLYADNFESYSSTSPNWLATGHWNNKYGNVTITTTNPFAGNQSVQMRVPANSSQVSDGLAKSITPNQDTLFVRFYEKFMSGYSASGSIHNGVSVTSHYTGPGTPANGTNFFESDVENSCDLGGAQPCYTNSYNYYVGQRDNYGDHWYPNGTILPNSSLAYNWGPYFIPRPQFVPNENQWYSYELMVHANTPGLSDGRVAVWVNGNLIADWQNIVFRNVNTLQIDLATLQFYLGSNPNATDETIWFDNVVMATSYIGPMSTTSNIAPPTNLTAVVK
jgi:hypothetical protein